MLRNHNAFGNKLLELMEEDGMSCKELSVRTGVHYNTVLKWINGNTEPTVTSIKKLCVALGTTPNELVGGLFNEHKSEDC